MSGSKWAHFQVGFLNIFLGATGTTYMIAYFHSIGFSKTLIGIYGSVVGLASLVSLLGSWVAQKAGTYKKIAHMLLILAAAFCTAGVVVAYLFRGSAVVQYVVLLLMAFYQVGLYMVTPVILSWYHNVVGNGRWADFYSTRMIVGDMSLLSIYLLMGLFLGISSQAISFVCVFIVSALFGLISNLFMNKIPDSVVSEVQPTVKTYAKVIIEAFKRPILRNLLIVIILRSFAYSLVMPFQSLYLLERLGVDYGLLSLLTVLGACASVAAYKFWARLQKRIGNSNCLKLTLMFSIIDPVLWFTASQGHIAGIYVAFIFFGVAGAQGIVNAGYITSATGMIFDYSDGYSKPVYASLYYLAFGAPALVAPLLGGLILENFSASGGPLLLFGFSMDGYRWLFVLTALLLIAGTILAQCTFPVKKGLAPAKPRQ